MPTYEYRCRDCHHRFEARQAITAAPLVHCPSCGGATERVISGGAGFIIRGGQANSRAASSGGCSLEKTGKTCCGREARCDQPGCGEDKE